GCAREAEPERAFQADAVVPGRIHAAIRDANVPAAVYVHPIAVGINQQIVYGEVIHARGENSEMPAVENGKIAQRDVAAILQADRFIGHARRFGARPGAISAAEPAAPQKSRASNGNVLDLFAPDQAVVPVAMAEI